MRPLENFIAVILVSLLLPLCAAAGSTVLDYSSLDLSDAVLVTAPVSVFHDWSESKREAETVVNAWKTEPTSLAWTRILLARHIKHKTMPTRGARGLALVHVAMHDAYCLALTKGWDSAHARLAMSMAAAEVLSYLYVAEERAFVRIAFEIAALSSNSSVNALPDQSTLALALGSAVAAKIIQRAQTDGAQRGWNGSRLQYYGQDRYYGPGSWEPTPPYFYYPPDEPFAPSWATWALKSQNQFRPVPPAFGSNRYLNDLREVIRINTEILLTTPKSSESPGQLGIAVTPPAPSDERFRIAKFWVDGHGSVTPPGHWNQIAITEVLNASFDDKKTLELFAQLNIGLADTFIAIWDAKYHYWTMRPVTAAKKLLGVDLKPVLLTPPFPSYPSGHAGFSACAAQILSHYFPQEAEKLDAMANEAAMSRLYGGIHFRFDDTDGLALGRSVAEATLTRFPF